MSKTGNVRQSCEAAGVTRQAAYARRVQDEAFAAAWQEALDEACDRLEQVARVRAEKTSDTLLIFLLKAHRPEKYRETIRNEHTGAEGEPIRIEATQRDLAGKLDRLRQIQAASVSEELDAG